MTKKVLCVGLICVDLVQVCNGYPIEDTDQRDIECRLTRGGNASNNCTVLSLLGTPCECLGTMAGGPFLQFLINHFEKYGIDVQHCRVYKECDPPLSTIIINSLNGSRTIIHSNKNLPELSIADFEKVNLDDYSWIHFEGRNTFEIEKMITYIREERPSMKISIELEKPCRELLKLVPMADLVFVGKDFSIPNGWNDMENTLEQMKSHIKPSASVICTWGEKGAMAMGPNDAIYYSPAHTPEKVMDTLGAGDTFCAAAIHSILKEHSLKEATEFACYIAGVKVGMSGYDNLKKYVEERKDP